MIKSENPIFFCEDKNGVKKGYKAFSKGVRYNGKRFNYSKYGTEGFPRGLNYYVYQVTPYEL